MIKEKKEGLKEKASAGQKPCCAMKMVHEGYRAARIYG